MTKERAKDIPDEYIKKSEAIDALLRSSPRLRLGAREPISASATRTQSVIGSGLRLRLNAPLYRSRIHRESAILNIGNIKAADVAPIRRGEWLVEEAYENVTVYHCSECGRLMWNWNDKSLKDYPYCHCGAMMDLEE